MLNNLFSTQAKSRSQDRMPIQRSQGQTQQRGLFDTQVNNQLSKIAPPQRSRVAASVSKRIHDLPSRTINFEDVFYPGSLNEDTQAHFSSQTRITPSRIQESDGLLQIRSYDTPQALTPPCNALIDDSRTQVSRASATSTYVTTQRPHYQSSPSPSSSTGSHAPQVRRRKAVPVPRIAQDDNEWVDELETETRDLVGLVEEAVSSMSPIRLNQIVEETMNGKRKPGGKLRTTVYGPHEKAAKNKSHSRCMTGVRKKLRARLAAQFRICNIDAMYNKSQILIGAFLMVVFAVGSYILLRKLNRVQVGFDSVLLLQDEVV
jgi:hypothetical protein